MEICAAFNNCIFYSSVRIITFFTGETMSNVFRTASVITSFVTLMLFVLCGTFIAYVGFFIVIPTELETSESMFLFALRVFVVTWLFYSVVFHYMKTRFLHPVANPGVPGDDYCIKCSNWKGEDTRHCMGCDRCIWKMDHHCPWVGQCVGAHNQAHFFAFLLNLLLASLASFLMAPGFWYNHVSNLYDRKETMKEECYWPICFNVWYRVLLTASDRQTLAVSSLLALFLMLIFFMTTFLSLYIFLIAGGSTYLQTLITGEKKKTKKPWNFRIARSRFRKYFQMASNESYLKLFFIPRSRKIVKYNEDKIVGLWL